MAVTSTAITYLGTGPTQTGQVLAGVGNDPQSRTLAGTFTLTLDGAATTVDVNWIDGTKTLPFTPSGVIICRHGGDETTAIDVGATALTTTKMSLKLGAAGTNTKTVACTCLIFK